MLKKKPITKIIFPLFLAIMLTSCAPSHDLNLKKDELTGKTYCLTTHHLNSSYKTRRASLILRYTEDKNSANSNIKATLDVCLHGRNYHVSEKETLTLITDGHAEHLKVQLSLNDPTEHVEFGQVSLPSGNVSVGNVTEITNKKFSFFLSNDQIARIAKSKRAAIELFATGKKSKNSFSLIKLHFPNDEIEYIKKLHSQLILKQKPQVK